MLSTRFDSWHRYVDEAFSMADRTSVWDAWMLGTLASFLVLEVVAYRTDRFPTLSRVLRRYLGIDPKSKHGQVAPVVFAGFWLGLTAHLLLMEARQLEDLVSDLRDPALSC